MGNTENPAGLNMNLLELDDILDEVPAQHFPEIVERLPADQLDKIFAEESPTSLKDRFMERYEEVMDRSQLLDDAMAAMSAGAYETAESLFKKAIEEGKSIGHAANGLGWLYWKFMSEPYEADECFRLGIENGCNRAASNLANLLVEQKRDAEVRDVWEFSREHGNQNAANNLGNFYAKNHILEGAEASYKNGIEDGCPEAHFNLGVLYAKQEKNKEAEEQYRLAIQKGVEDGETHCNLGYVLSKQGKEEDAEKEYKIAMGLGDTMAIFNLGHLSAQKGNHEEAAEMYRQVILKESSNKDLIADTYNNLGNIYAKQWKFDNAINSLQIAVAMGCKLAKNNLKLAQQAQHSSPGAALDLILERFVETGLRLPCSRCS